MEHDAGAVAPAKSLIAEERLNVAHSVFSRFAHSLCMHDKGRWRDAKRRTGSIEQCAQCVALIIPVDVTNTGNMSMNILVTCSDNSVLGYPQPDSQ